MKNLKWFPLACLLAVLPLIAGSGTATENKKVARAEEKSYASVYMIDYDTGAVLLGENENERRPIASMVKIMTLLLTFEEIESGKMTLDEKITVSDNAAGMGGSQLFLNAGQEYAVSDLIKGVTVCSANDGAVALAERISGTTEAFVVKMNQRAKKLGMFDTLFCNATGLPQSGEQYSTAKDVTVMMKELIKHPRYFDFTKIWMENFVHPDGRITQIVNTNKLIRTGAHCDGGKTGYTNEAKFCLSATGKVNDMRVICTVLGFSDGKERFKKVNEWMNYAFAHYENKVYVKANEPIESDIAVKKGKEKITNVYCDTDLKVFGKRGDFEKYTVKVTFDENLCAPIAKDEPVGKIAVVGEEGEISSGILRAGCSIDKMSFWDNLKYILQNKTVSRKK